MAVWVSIATGIAVAIILPLALAFRARSKDPRG